MTTAADSTPQAPIDPSVTDDEKNVYRATHAGQRAATRRTPNMPPPGTAIPQSPLGLAPAPAAPVPVVPYVEERWEVLEDCEIPHKASKFHLSRGQIVSTALFDIAGIKRGGAKLKQLPSVTFDPSKA